MSDPPSVMTVEEFLDWETPDGSDRWELVDGTPMAIGPPHPGMAQFMPRPILPSQVWSRSWCFTPMNYGQICCGDGRTVNGLLSRWRLAKTTPCT